MVESSLFHADDVVNAIRNEIHNKDNILYNYAIPLTIPILECINPKQAGGEQILPPSWFFLNNF